MKIRHLIFPNKKELLVVCDKYAFTIDLYTYEHRIVKVFQFCTVEELESSMYRITKRICVMIKNCNSLIYANGISIKDKQKLKNFCIRQIKEGFTPFNNEVAQCFEYVNKKHFYCKIIKKVLT